MEALNDAPIAVHPVDVRGLVSTSEGFRRAVDDSSAHYLLGYHLDTKNDKPGWRKLKTMVQQKDAVVHARSGFLVTNAVMNPQATKDLDLGFALNFPFEASGIPIRNTNMDAVARQCRGRQSE